MKKLLLVLCVTVFIFGCSSDDNSNSSSPYSPPTWIQGTWGHLADQSNGKDEPVFKITSDNLCQLSGILSTCWKESIQQTPQYLSGSDSHTDTTYDINFISQNGASTINLKFKKISTKKILWLDPNGNDLELDKLD